MKITVKQLKRLIREAVEDSTTFDSFFEELTNLTKKPSGSHSISLHKQPDGMIYDVEFYDEELSINDPQVGGIEIEIDNNKLRCTLRRIKHLPRNQRFTQTEYHCYSTPEQILELCENFLAGADFYKISGFLAE